MEIAQNGNTKKAMRQSNHFEHSLALTLKERKKNRNSCQTNQHRRLTYKSITHILCICSTLCLKHSSNSKLRHLHDAFTYFMKGNARKS